MLRELYGRTLLTRSLADQRRSLVWWAIAMIALVGVYVPIYPQYREQGLLDLKSTGGMMSALGIDELTSPEGYLQATLFGLVGSLLLVVFGVVSGTRAIAGDEEAGTLELLITHPVSRTRLLVRRFGALVLAVTWVTFVVWAMTAITVSAADLDVPLSHSTAAAAGLGLLGLTFAALSLALGALIPRRAPVLGISAAVAVAAYLADTFAPQIDGLAWLRKLSPFYYGSGAAPVRTGWHLGHVGVLIAIIAVLLGIAVWAFNRRDATL